MLVIDANIAVLFAIENPIRQRVIEQFTIWQNSNEQLIAPSVFASETTSALTKAVHFSMLTVDEAVTSQSLITELPIELVLATPKIRFDALHWTVKLGRVAAYDSFYLALAEQNNATLWTRDKKLVNAANKPWVRYLEDTL